MKRGYRHKKRRIKRIARQRRGSNPFKKERGKIATWIFNIINIALLGFVGYLLYFFFISTYFVVDDISVSGMKFVSTGDFIQMTRKEVESETFFGLPTQNIHLVSLGDLRKAIERQYLFESLEIKRVYPNQIQIYVEERNVQYRLFSASHEYLIDDEGVVVKKITNYAYRPKVLSIINDQEDKEEKVKMTFRDNDIFPSLYVNQDITFGIGQQILTVDQVTFFNRLLEKRETDMYALQSVQIAQAFPQNVTVSTQEGWDVVFNTNNDLEVQFERLKLVLEQEIGDQRSRLDYIDLSLGKNIYYKYQ